MDAIKKCDHASLVKPFLTCLTDKKGEIRKMSEELIVTLMGFAIIDYSFYHVNDIYSILCTFITGGRGGLCSSEFY